MALEVRYPSRRESPGVTRLREAWEFGRDQLLEEWVRDRPGTRPPGWWRFSAPEPRRTGELEPAYLRRLGLLLQGEEERV